MKYIIAALFIIAPLTYAHANNSIFCQRVMMQMDGYDPYGGDKTSIDREAIGDAAYRAGIRYLYLKVPITRLPEVLRARYLPDLEAKDPRSPRFAMLDAASTAKVGTSAAVTLGGLNIPLSRADAAILGQEGRVRIEPNRNTNALILYSPRVLSLLPWYWGNRLFLRKDPVDKTTGTLKNLCKGWSCVSSSNSRDLIQAAFQGIRSAHEYGESESWSFRIEGTLPSYEIVGVVVQPENRNLLNNVLASDPTLATWNNHLIYADTFPNLDPRQTPYLKEHLAAVAEDLNPVAASGARDVTFGTPAFRHTSDFEEQVRRTASRPGFVEGKIDELHADYGFIGVSEYEIRRFREIEAALSEGGLADGRRLPAYLPQAKLTRFGYFEVKALREWTFQVAEYTGKDGARVIALIIRNDGDRTPPEGVPYALWGIGLLEGEAGKATVKWLWTPSQGG